MAKTKSTLDKKQVIESAKGLKLLGWMIYYKTSKFSIPFDEFKTMLTQAGIDPNMAKQTNLKNAAIRAVQKRRKANKLDVYQRREEDGKTVFVTAKTEVNEDNTSADLTKQDLPIWDKELKEFAGDADLTKEAQKHQEFYEADQFRTVALRYLQRECAALTVLDTGGMYFVPRSRQDELEKLTKLFEIVGRGCTVTPIPVVDTEQSRSAMWETLVGEVTQDIETLKRDFEKKDEVNDKGLASRLRKYKATKTKVELFETVLQGAAENLKKELDDLTKALHKKLAVE